MFDLSSIKVWLEVLLLLIPVIVTMILIYKLVLPRNPKLGLGLMAGAGLIGAFLINRKLKKAFAVEDKLSEFNEDYARFKEIQKRRQQAVSANQEVIKVLEQRRKKMEKDALKYKTELQLIDAELKDRKALNEQLLKDASSFVSAARERSRERKKLLSTLPPEEHPQTADPEKPIEIDGYRLTEE